jgi:hypothetical protein
MRMVTGTYRSILVQSMQAMGLMASGRCTLKAGLMLGMAFWRGMALWLGGWRVWLVGIGHRLMRKYWISSLFMIAWQTLVMSTVRFFKGCAEYGEWERSFLLR